MKKIYHIFAILALLGTGIAHGSITSSFYAKRSVLADGKWVKVGVKETGVYEISYDQLREMGFSNPQKVNIYGKGGALMPENFTQAGTASFSDDLRQIPVMHHGEKLYFYGQGPVKMKYTADLSYEAKGYFSREYNNIYTNYGYYFLTDSGEEKNIPTQEYSAGGISMTKGMSYVYHELDSAHNVNNSGQLFWGERLGLPGAPGKNWDVEMPDAIAGPGIMECIMYFSNHEGISANVSYGFEGKEGENYFKTPYATSGNTYFTPFAKKLAQVAVPGTTGKVFARLDCNVMMNQSNLDYWVVSYQREIPTLKDVRGNYLTQQLFALNELTTKNSVGDVTFENCQTYMVFDVTSPDSPKNLQIKMNGGKGSISATNNGSVPQLIVFDTSRTQHQITGFEQQSYSLVANQNLHDYKDRGADFVIITTPEFRTQAEQIADLHREYDGLEVLVATTEECYNEFSGGVPDPMAYRSLMKMLYMTDRKPKNLLLFGPLHGDFRGMLRERDPLAGIIAYQSPNVSIQRGAFNINDFYGCMNDTYRTDYYERNEVQIGVGILPVKFSNEADIIVEKIRNYLERTDYAYYLNRFTIVGGIGDEHTHDSQIRIITNDIHDNDMNSTAVSPLSIDTYGNREAHKKFINEFNEGRNLIAYFGHGAEQFLGKDRLFFSAGDVTNLRNESLPFGCFAGCQITNTDRGMRGLGETIVTTTPHGMIGCLVSARETWSGQNYEFFKLFYSQCYRTGDPEKNSKFRETQATIGEIYAEVKNYSQFQNELAYQLLCDPALKIPFVTHGITLQANPEAECGETLTLKGYVNTRSDEKDATFNGEVVVRLMEPTKDIACGMIESKENPGTLSFTYEDTQLAMGVGEVKNGEFEVTLHVPGAASAFANEHGNLFISAYDPSDRRAAGAKQEVSFKVSASGTSSESGDVTPPAIEVLGFDQSTCSVELTVSDNLALNMSGDPMNKGLFLFVDGKEDNTAHFIKPRVENGRAAYSKTIPLEGLTYGEHSLRLKVKDAAGNATENEMTFTYNPEMARYRISLSPEHSEDTRVIVAEGVAPSNARLIIVDSNGSEIVKVNFNNGRYEWNIKNVAPGHYKGYIIEQGTSTTKGHSETIDIPVI